MGPTQQTSSKSLPIAPQPVPPQVPQIAAQHVFPFPFSTPPKGPHGSKYILMGFDISLLYL